DASDLLPHQPQRKIRLSTFTQRTNNPSAPNQVNVFVRYMSISPMLKFEAAMRVLIVAAAVAMFVFPGTAAERVSDTQVRQTIIAQSIASYRGPCPCPYNVMRNGQACGGRSAYSRPGGASPICYPEQVTQSMIERYRAGH